MSASQEKKRRREERAESPEIIKAKKRAVTHQTLKKTIITIVVVLVVIGIAFAVVWNSALFYTGISALKVGDWKYNAAEFNYYYKGIFLSTYSNIYNTYGDYSYLLLDASKPLDEQQYSDDQTWDQYFETYSLNRMQQVSMLVDAAEAEGWTMTDDAKTELSTTLSQAKENAVSNNVSFKSYLTSVYGKYMDESLYTKLLTNDIIAKYYSTAQLDRLDYSEEDVDARYDELSQDYNLITYYSYYVDGSADEENGIDEDTAMNNAYNTATAISAGKAEDVFAELVYNYAPEDKKEDYKDPDSCRHANVAPSNMSGDDVKAWLTDPARTYGDTTVIEGASGYTVYLWTESNDNSYTLRSFRVMMVAAEADSETGEITDATVATAKAEADSLYAQWQEDPTEDKFAELATANSDDTQTSSNGGLYSNVYMGYLDSSLESWLFDDARQEGDTTTIFIKNSNATGYYILYYIGQGDRYDRQIATNNLKEEWFTNWVDGNKDNYQISKTLGFKFTK